MAGRVRVPFAAVASPDGDILASYSATTGGNACDLAQKILHRLDKDSGGPSNKRSFAMGHDGFAFRIMWAPNGYTFVMLERALGDQAVWRCLSRLQKRFEARYGEGAGMSEVVIIFPPVTRDAASEFVPTLEELLREANRLPAAKEPPTTDSADESLRDVHGRLEQVRDVMADSIEKVLERGEKIDVLVDRAERLEANATTFSKSSTGLKQNLRWHALRWKVLMYGSIAVTLLYLISSACDGLTGCFSSSAAPSAAEASGFTRIN